MWVLRILICAIGVQIAAAMPAFNPTLFRNANRRSSTPTPAVVPTPAPDSPGHGFELPTLRTLDSPGRKTTTPNSPAAQTPTPNSPDGAYETQRWHTTPTLIITDGARTRSVLRLQQEAGSTSDPATPASEHQTSPDAARSSRGTLELLKDCRPSCLHVETPTPRVPSPRTVSDFLSTAAPKNVHPPTRAQRAHLKVSHAVNDLVKIAKELDDYFVARNFYGRQYHRWWPSRRRDFLSAIEIVQTLNKLRDEKIRAQPDMAFKAIATEIIAMYTPIYQLLGQLETFQVRSARLGEPFQPASFCRHQIWLRKRVPDDLIMRKILDYAGDWGLFERTHEMLDKTLDVINDES